VAVAANGGGGGSPSSVLRWCLVAVSVVVVPMTERVVVGSPPSHTTSVPTSVGHPYRRRAVVARPAAAPPTGAQRNRHGNRSPLPLTNPFGTTDRPLTPRAPALEHTATAASRSVVAAYHTHEIVSTLFHTRAHRRRHFLVTRDFFNSSLFSLFVGILGKNGIYTIITIIINIIFYKYNIVDISNKLIKNNA